MSLRVRWWVIGCAFALALGCGGGSGGSGTDASCAVDTPPTPGTVACAGDDKCPAGECWRCVAGMNRIVQCSKTPPSAGGDGGIPGIRCNNTGCDGPEDCPGGVCWVFESARCGDENHTINEQRACHTSCDCPAGQTCAGGTCR